MFTTTPEQDYLLSILQKTKVMRKDQAAKLLSGFDTKRDAGYTSRCLAQLQHIRKIKWSRQRPDDVFTLPLLYQESIDEDMLSAIDIMADLSDSKIIALSTTQPYKLYFYIAQENSFWSYAVITVQPGSEALVSTSLIGVETENRTLIFLLSNLEQKDNIRTSLPHFFAVNDGGKYRYFYGEGM